MRRVFACFVVLAVAVLGLGVPAHAKELPVVTPLCGSTVTISFKLGADRTCTGDGFTVTTDGITIDLNGHTISGDGDGADRGIRTTFGGMEILNGVWQTSVHGLSFEGPKGSAEGVVAADNTNAGIYSAAAGTKLTDVTAVANSRGIDLQGSGEKVISSRIAGNSIGVFISANKVTIKNSYLAGNLGQGLAVHGAGHKISGNTFAGNGISGSPGVELLADVSKTSVSKNHFVGNGDDGYRDLGTGNKASGNFAYGNGFDSGEADGVGTGIDATSAIEPKVKGNFSNGNDASTQCVPTDGCTAPKAENLPLMTPVCGASISQSFRLGSNMSCTGHGLVVTQPNITIDLDNHTISGDGDNADAGILNDGTVVPGSGDSSVTIRNGVIRRFGTGVKLGSTAQVNTVEGITSVRNTLFGFLLAGNGNTVRNSVAVANDANGIDITGTSMHVESNYVSNNLTGVKFSSLGTAELIGNHVSGNRNDGLVSNAVAIHYTENTFAGNGVFAEGHGLQQDVGGIATQAFSNVFFGNSGDGYHDEADAFQIVGNIAVGNGFLALVGGGAGTGISAAGTLNGSDNFALGNDAADQCEPDFLCQTA